MHAELHRLLISKATPGKRNQAKGSGGNTMTLPPPPPHLPHITASAFKLDKQIDWLLNGTPTRKLSGYNNNNNNNILA